MQISPHTSYRINQARLKDNFEALAEIGRTPDGGVHRPAFSGTHLAARAWFADTARAAGFPVQVDGAGNRIVRFETGADKSFLLGSHLDSVPNGGRFDGALGVLAALEVLQTIKENHIPLQYNLEAVDFTDEEGRYQGLFGSQAMTGDLSARVLGAIPDIDSTLGRDGLTKNSVLTAARPLASLAGYLELHIEQGTRLERASAHAGVVTAIVGVSRCRLSFLGKADHAGTTPMADRRDAAQGASSFTQLAFDLVLTEYPECVVNIGDMIFSPGAFNVVPERVDLLLEFRGPEPDQISALQNRLLALASAQADRFALGLETQDLESIPPARMSPTAQNAITRSAEILGITAIHLSSGAGHDAQTFAAHCPTGMIFVPSTGGHSHSPAEYTAWEDCVYGADLLLQAALALVGAAS